VSAKNACFAQNRENPQQKKNLEYFQGSFLFANFAIVIYAFSFRYGTQN
jgi:hypothetical protein